MHIAEIQIRGYRNFKAATIKFDPKATLIVGANDVGKTNLLRALRLLLDRDVPESALEPEDSDFFAYEETNELYVRIEFHCVTQDCVLSRMKDNVSDDGKMFLAYRGVRDPQSGRNTYELLAGHDPSDMREIGGRIYLKVLNLRYLRATRDLTRYLIQERQGLLQDAREEREDTEAQADSLKTDKIRRKIKALNHDVLGLSYVANASKVLNDQLVDLSEHHSYEQVGFDVVESGPDDLLRNLKLVADLQDKHVPVAGDGRTNQVFFATWAARNRLHQDNQLEVSIICVEEPEAHLHPHQQRRLARYLAARFPSQVLMTTHSPHIACEFAPHSIARLVRNRFYDGTTAACDGCSEEVEAGLIAFGHRLSIVPADAFFADLVFLVEGVSEVLFYRALAHKIGVDLDHLNVALVPVEGVGFRRFVDLLWICLDIEFILRTDLDIAKVPRKEEFRAQGIERCIKLCRELLQPIPALENKIVRHQRGLRWSGDILKPPGRTLRAFASIRKELVKQDIFIGTGGLEADLLESPLRESVFNYLGTRDRDKALELMTAKKGTFMYSFLSKRSKDLECLKEDGLARPLFRCQEIIRERRSRLRSKKR